ncbi:hypothetical protein ANN_19613 [Periplaneta americana]|uniref:Reverse transcriptase n=1 Tax=Periplaneta americana TaxID=6978 RepID=A0ABQ8SAL0_PERAM|nr:hypothetical protein ANN_19613 [Periplaneta americana]
MGSACGCAAIKSVEGIKLGEVEENRKPREIYPPLFYDTLIEFAIPKKLDRLSKLCLSETYSRVRIGQQGDALSRLLLSFALENAIRKVLDKRESLELNGLHQLLGYADGVNMLGEFYLKRDAIKMVGNVAVVRAIPGRSMIINRCRHCFNEIETLAHVFGSCPHGPRRLKTQEGFLQKVMKEKEKLDISFKPCPLLLPENPLEQDDIDYNLDLTQDSNKNDTPRDILRAVATETILMRIRNETVLERADEERMIAETDQEEKKNWLGHCPKRNSVPKDALEGMMSERRIRGRRRYVRDDIKIYGLYAETKRKTENKKDDFGLKRSTAANFEIKLERDLWHWLISKYVRVRTGVQIDKVV